MTVPMWDHQRQAFRFAQATSPGVMAAMGMGIGKSRVAVELVRDERPRGSLFLCPASVLGVWRREFATWAPTDVELCVLEKGDSKAKAKLMNHTILLGRGLGRPAVVVANYESVRQPALLDMLLSFHWERLFLDESHRVKDPNGAGAKAAFLLSKRSTRRMALTGTPMPHSPLDIFSQYRCLNPKIFGWKWSDFRARHAELGGFQNKQVVGVRDADRITEGFQSIAFQRSTEDCVDLPTLTTQHIPVIMNRAAMTAYQTMEAQFWAEVKDGVVTADNAMVKLLRLQQIACGYLPTPDGEHAIEWFSHAKAEALDDLLEDAPLPAVVFCRFRPDLGEVARIAAKRGLRYGEISGLRKDLTNHGTMPEGIDLMGVQIQSGGVGIDLTRAQTFFVYSMGFSLGDHDQAVARLIRPNQKASHVTGLYLLAQGTVDPRVVGAINRRRNIVETVMAGGRDHDPGDDYIKLKAS